MSEGDIGAVIDSHVFAAPTVISPEIIHVDGDIYAVVFTGAGNHGFVSTISIAESGTIGAAVIDTFEFNPWNCYTPNIIHVFGNIYAIASRGNDNDGFLTTVDIDSDGTIADARVDCFIFEAGNIMRCNILHVSGYVYAIAYEGPATDGWVCTVTISNAGDIGAAVVDTLEFDSGSGFEPKIIHVYGDVYAIAYKGTDNDGFVATVDINSAGEIGAAVIDTFEFDTADCSEPVIINVSDDIYAIAYRGVDGDGFVITVSISDAGSIGAAVIDSFEFEGSYCAHTSILHVSGDVYAIIYVGVSGDGFAVTVDIDSSGNIGAAVIDTLEFDTADCSEPIAIHITGNVYACIYSIAWPQGKLTTFDIETVIGGAPRHELLLGIG